MPLEQYRRKRNFGRTTEPSGHVGANASDEGVAGSLLRTLTARAGRFVVGRHRATRLHYDLRLEVGGVLVSWAVPRGPTLDPDARRMAIHVEDHPIEYLGFEGVIPRGEYGAGDAIAWDWGTFEPEAPTLDAAKAIRDGELKFSVEGQKLKGRFTIVRTGPGRSDRTAHQAGPETGGEQWLLIHKRDAFASEGWDAEDHPASVKTGLTNEEVGAGLAPRFAASPPTPEPPIDITAAMPAGSPGFIPPMLATLGQRPFDGQDWLFEVKWDGYRVEAVVRDGSVRLHTRNGNDAATYFPGFLSPPDWISAREAVLDGEVVALDPEGRPDFGVLQERLGVSFEDGGIRRRQPATSVPREPRGRLVYQVFDLLQVDGLSLLRVPLVERKRLLRRLLRDGPRIRYASHVEASGLEFFRAAERLGLEGVMAKRRASLYEPGRRTTSWLKLKIRPEQEFVVGGYLPGEGNARDLGAVLIGYQEGGQLRYAGRVGSGFDGRSRRQFREMLDRAVRTDSPFDPAPARTGDLRLAVWVEPELIIRVAFSNWTRDGVIRQPSFKGIEPDRDPATVVRERPVSDGERLVSDPARTSTSEPSQPELPRPEPPEATPTSAVSASAPPAGVGTRDGRPPEGRIADGEPPGPDLPQVATPGELAALERIGREGTWSVGTTELKLTNLDKVLFPPAADRPDDPPITKRELIRYLVRIAPTILPHLAERPLNVQRFPDGVGGEAFWQKSIPPTAPRWLRLWREVGVEDHRRPNTHLVADRVGTMAWLGNQAAFEIHPWTSRLDAPDRPTFALIDIDPGDRTTWAETIVLARLFRTALAHLGVTACPKTTGKRGIQVWVPVVPNYTYRETSAWVEGLSRAVGATVPDLVSWEWSKADRRGRARLDYTQNASIKTLVAPYAVRPIAGAPVSAPIAWDELDDPDLQPDRWTIRSAVERVEERGDLFARALGPGQELPSLT